MWRPYHQSYQRRKRSGWRRAIPRSRDINPCHPQQGNSRIAKLLVGLGLEAGSPFIIDLRQSPSPDEKSGQLAERSSERHGQRRADHLHGYAGQRRLELVRHAHRQR
jgi:hypothetical protein